LRRAEVEVLNSGTLAITSGPVRDSKGTVFATFTSVWRLEEGGKWRVIFDKGNPVCAPNNLTAVFASPPYH
jgi:hypothetical protein